MALSLRLSIALFLTIIKTAHASGPDCYLYKERPVVPTAGKVVVLDGGETIVDLVDYYRVLEDLPPAIIPEDPAIPKGWPEVAQLFEVEEDAYLKGDPSTWEVINCAPFAFRRAYEAYHERLKLYGEKDERLDRWLQAQREVFSNCRKEGKIPDPPSPRWSENERLDRLYQRASALMYSFQHEKAREEFKKLAVVDQRMAPLARYLAYRTVVRQASLSDGQVDIHSDLPGYVKEAAHALEKDLKNGDLGDYSYQGRLLLARLYGFSLLPQWRKKSADLLALESSTRTAHEGLTYAIRLFSRASYFGQQDQEGYVSPDIRWFDPDAPVPASHLERWLALVRCDREQKPEQCRKLATQWGGDPRSKAFAIAAALNDVNTPPLLKRLEELVTDPFAGPMARLLSATFLLNLGRRDEATALLRNLEGNSEPELSDAVHALLFEATEDKERRWKHLASLKRVSPRLHRFLEKLPLEELVIYAAHEDPLGFTKALRYYVLARSTVEGKEQVLREVLPLAAATYISSYPDKPSAEYQARKVLIEKYVKTVGSLSSPELLLLATFLTALSGTSPLELQPTTLYYGVCTPLWWCRPGPEGLLGTDYFIKKAEQYLREGPDHELLPAFISRVIWGVRASCASDKTDEKLEQIFRMFQKRYKGSVWARLTPHWYVPSFKPDKGEERYILTADRP